MKCRECLLQLVRSLAKPEMVPPGQDAPQRSNFISWSELIANTVASGGSAERVRGHLKATAKSAWELAGWLTHANGAGRHDATFALDATHTVLAAFGSAVMLGYRGPSGEGAGRANSRLSPVCSCFLWPIIRDVTPA